MKKELLTASLRYMKQQVRMSLEAYFFKDDDVTIMYCPALNLSAYGDTVEQAKAEFGSILQEHLEDCIEHGTLEQDLLCHGWHLKAENYFAPKTTDMLIANSTLRDIVDNKDYSKTTLPPFVFNIRRRTHSFA